MAALCALLLAGCARHDLFRDAAAETGLRFRHLTGATGHYYLPEIMGSGVALFDYDGDGDIDVFLVQGAPLESGRLFRNMLKETGKLMFEDVTERAGLTHRGYGMGVAVGDYDNDGHPDLYITNFGGNILYRNNGNGTFTDVTREAGVEVGGWSTSSAFLDYDRDGYLDLYVARYLDFTILGNKECFSPAGEPDYCAPSAYKPVVHRLFRNLGNGKFHDVTQAAGIDKAVGPGLGVVCADFNGDGWPDIYVANDGAANMLWLNDGHGHFKESALLSGAAYSADGVARAGMGVTAGDFDGSGKDSIVVTNLSREGATLYRNQGGGQFTDASVACAIHQPTFPLTGFGVEWFDYDNDGRLDLFIANGAVTGIEAQRGTAYPFLQKNLLLHNDGPKFHDASAEGGGAFQISNVGRGAAFGDIDNDGDIDIVIASNNGPARLLLNESARRGHWLEVRLQGAMGNREAIGARVSVKGMWRRVHTDGSYLSASDVRVHFGLGQMTVADILVEWPDGAKEAWKGVRGDSIVTLRQGSAQSR